jgi:diguanylate cyclase (GGDEF)-like protein
MRWSAQNGGDRLKTAPADNSLGPGSSAYFCCIVFLGLGVLGFSAYQVVDGSVATQWLLLAFLTAASGSFTVPIPGVKSKISVAESFIFTNTILFGPAVGAITAALDGISGCLRSDRSLRHLQHALFNMASMAISAYLAGKTFFMLLGHGPLYGGPTLTLARILLPVGAMALVHYLTNTLSVAWIIALETRRGLYHVWRERFLWTSVTYFAGASAASLIAVYLRVQTAAVIGVLLPLIFVTYFAFTSYLDKAKEKSLRRQLDALHFRTVEALSLAVDARESGTLGQAKKVQVYARGLARAIGITDDEELRGIEAAALLRDIGNLAVPEAVLNNPGELTSAEFQKVMTHPGVGANILSTIGFPPQIVECVRHHHEHWNGSGYPDGLEGTEISLGARILALADGYVALTCDRPYQKARSREDALRELQARAGTRYDPELVEKLIHVNEDLTAQGSMLGERSSVDEEEPRRKQLPEEAALVENGFIQSLSNLGAYMDISSTQKETSVLRELSTELGTTLNLQETHSIVAAKIAKLVPFTSCVIYLLNGDRGRVVAGYASGVDAEAFQGYSMEFGEQISGWVVAHEEAVINANAGLDLAKIYGKLTAPVDLMLAHPLSFEDTCIGAISLYASREKKFKDEDLRIVGGIALKAAPAIQRALRYEEAQEEAIADSLTKLSNMRYLQKYFVQETAKAKRYWSPLSLLAMDLDGFKEVNDRLGHQAGDRVLVEVAQALKGMLRGSDLAVRHGGDEFIVVLHQTTFEEASLLAKRLQQKIDTLSIEVSPGKFAQVGISVGGAACPEHGSTLKELLEVADAAMYRNKRDRARSPRTA